MHNNISYAKSPAPAFDAVQDLKDWFGDKYDNLANQMKNVKNPRTFSMFCSMGGVEGFPVKCWYELFNGEGSWDREWTLIENDEFPEVSASEQADLQDE